MKRLYSNNNGVALVTALMLTMISLVIVVAVMYIITQSVQQVGMYKRYKTAIAASYGGTDIVMKELVPQILKNIESSTLFSDLQVNYASIGLAFSSDANIQQCFLQKLNRETSGWTQCSVDNLSMDPKQQPDIKLNLQSLNGAPYTIYAKIIDTVAGNTDMSGLQLEGAGVAESLTVLNPKQLPYVYRMEIQAEKSTNAIEQGSMTVVYAY